MIDKRPFYSFLYELKQSYPDKIAFIESIEEGFDDVPPISTSEVRALKLYPVQFVQPIHQEGGEWTSKLHIWGEHGVIELLDLDPIYLGFKNSLGDTVLMSLAVAGTGTHTGHPDYKLLSKLVQKDYAYEEKIKNDDGEYEIVVRNAMEETDINGKRPIDYLYDVAFSTGDYEGEPHDTELQKILTDSGSREKYNLGWRSEHLPT